MKAFLQGKWLQHPLHPMLVHFPIGLWVLSLLMDLGSLLAGPNNALVRGAFYTMALGTIVALLAAVAGLADWLDIRADHPAKSPATYHMWLNLGVMVLYGINLNVRYANLSAAQTPVLGLLMSILGIITISISGYLGGMIVYDDGVGVGRHRRKTDTPRDTIRATSRSTAPLNGFVPVAHARALPKGETLRAEVDGNVITIANLDGEFYAFQEFCTHRFGPLSEGAFVDGQIECPWHRSCFDIRTGKATKGPAKVDLKTYEVRVEDGRIMVKP